MIKAESKIFDDETGEILWHGVASPDEVWDYPEIVNVNSNGAHEIIPEIVFTLVADNLEKVSKDIQTEEVKLSELYKQQRDMLGFLKDNGILKQPDDKQTGKDLSVQ